MHGHLQHVALGLAASSRASGAGWASATRTRTCSASSTWCPARARERILDIAATQLPTGGAYHQYQPLTKRGNDDVGSGFNDDPAWLVLGVAAYLKETGDAAILDEAGALRQPAADTEQPLYEHLQRAIAYTLDRLGPHGLPLIGRADWNDCLNLNCFSETPGESFQTTENKERRGRRVGLHRRAVRPGGGRDGRDRRRAASDGKRGRPLPRGRGRMVAAVDEHGWDGAWFRRAYDYFGRVIGSAANDEGQIFIEPQGMCVMAGIGLTDGRAERALDSVRERLATPHGIVLQQPAYTRYHLAPRRDLLLPAGLQGERRRSSATPTRGS